MHFTVRFLLELLLVVVATAAPTGPDADSNEQHIAQLPESASDEDSCGLTNLQVAEAMANESDDASILSLPFFFIEEGMDQPAAPVLIKPNLKRPASAALDMNLAILNAATNEAKRRRVSNRARETQDPVTQEASSFLIELQDPSRGGPNGKATVLSVWTIWNEQLRNPDPFHTALIKKYEDKLYVNGRSGTNLAEKWVIKYRYYKEIGKEIDRRLAKNYGKSLERIIGRLEFIRNNIYNRKTVKALVDGICIARGEDPIIPGRSGRDGVDIKALLDAE
jgi:hypothetical protein